MGSQLERDRDAWPPEIQAPPCPLLELLFWRTQWHNDLNPEAGMGFGDYLAGFLYEEARKQGTTVEALERLLITTE